MGSIFPIRDWYLPPNGQVGGGVKADAGVESVSVEAVVIRRDGTREDLGQIAYYHKNPLRRLAWRLRNMKGS